MSGKTLELIHVIFRHGQKTPDDFTLYKEGNETNSNEYYPYGIGQLTNKGKKDMYELGEELREHYGDFLGEIYLSKHIDALSSEFERCRASLSLVLAGLYPPKGDLIWNDELQWQPIPTKYIPAQNDTIFVSCVSQEYREMYKEYFKKSRYGQKLLKDNKDVMIYIKEHTGLEMYDTSQILKIRDCLMREKMFNIQPKWVTDSLMSKLEKIAVQELNVVMAETVDLKRVLHGSLLEKIVHDSKQKIQGKSTRKIHLYGGHDINIVGILDLLEVLKPHLPEEGSCVVVELYSTKKGYAIQVKYKNSSKGSFDIQRFPDGQPTWAFDKLEEILEKYRPRSSGIVSESDISDRLYTK